MLDSGNPHYHIDEKADSKHDSDQLHQSNSFSEAQAVDDRNGQFHRSFSPRQVHVRYEKQQHELYRTALTIIKDHFSRLQHW